MAWSRLNKYERRSREGQRATERDFAKRQRQQKRDALKARREADLAKRKEAQASVRVRGEEVRLQDTELWNSLVQVSALLYERLKKVIRGSLTRGKGPQ